MAATDFGPTTEGNVVTLNLSNRRNQNDVIIARIRGVPASKGTGDTDRDERNPNVKAGD